MNVSLVSRRLNARSVVLSTKHFRPRSVLFSGGFRRQFTNSRAVKGIFDKNNAQSDLTKAGASASGILNQAKQAVGQTVAAGTTLSKQALQKGADAASELSKQALQKGANAAAAVSQASAETAAQILDKTKAAAATTSEAAAKAFESGKKTVQEGASAAATAAANVASSATKPVADAVDSVYATGRRVRRLMILCGVLGTALAIGCVFCAHFVFTPGSFFTVNVNRYVAKPWAPLVTEMWKARQAKIATASSSSSSSGDKDKDKKS